MTRPWWCRCGWRRDGGGRQRWRGSSCLVFDRNGLYYVSTLKKKCFLVDNIAKKSNIGCFGLLHIWPILADIFGWHLIWIEHYSCWGGWACLRRGWAPPASGGWRCDPPWRQRSACLNSGPAQQGTGGRRGHPWLAEVCQFLNIRNCEL